MIKSPITGGETRILEEIDVAEIISAYGQLNVSSFFSGTDKVQTLECLDTKYKFFYPFSLAGNSDYYKAISNNSKDEKYYPKWKWEHKRALGEIKKGDKILEIGCGPGNFLLKAREIGAKCFGIELNQEAVRICLEKGLAVKNIMIENYEQGSSGTFDCICAFQVLEHVADIRSFMLNINRLLKTGGKLIIGVPNNDSFIKNDSFNRENMPPHHMGLWSKEPLTKMAKYFDLKVETVEFEPLQKYHFAYFYNLTIGNKLRELGLIGRAISKILYMFIFRPFLAIFHSSITGHTVVAIYHKSNGNF